MLTQPIAEPGLTTEELRGFGRTVAEIEWLLLILVLLYHVVVGGDEESSAAVYISLLFYAVFVMSFQYAHFYRQKKRWTLALETWAMIGFITWVLVYTGRLDSALVNLYLLVIITSALTLGKLITLLEVGLIAACYVFLAYPKQALDLVSLSYAITLGTQLAPVLLVAYITTMLSSDIRSALAQIKLLSEMDELTGVYNMRAFKVIVERTLWVSTRYAHPFSLLMIDSDSLKNVNDKMGHEAGNRLLKQTVMAIHDHLRQTDVVARYGGDEFVVLLLETSSQSAFDVAERIRRTIEARPLITRGKQLVTTVSIGIAGFPDHGQGIDVLLEKADQAMYASKTRGKNCVTVHSGS